MIPSCMQNMSSRPEARAVAATPKLSSRPEGRALCGPQRRNPGTIPAIPPPTSFRAERPDCFFRAGLWRVGSRSRGISLPTVAQTLLSVFSGFSFVAAAFRGGRLCPLSFRPTSASGATQVSPARKGWVPSKEFLLSAVGAALFFYGRTPSFPTSAHPNPSSLAAHPNPSFRAESAERGIPLLPSWLPLLCVPLLSILCALCVPISVNSVLPSLFSFSSLRSSANSALLRHLFLSFDFQLSTFDFQPSSSEPT